MKKRIGAAQNLAALVTAYRAQIANAIAVNVRCHLSVEVVLILDDPGDNEWPTGSTGDLDRVGSTLLAMNASEEDQLAM